MQENQSLFSLNFDTTAKSHLLDTAKWARFLSISGMIIMAIFIALAFIGFSVMGSNPTYDTAPEMFGQMRIVMILTSIVMGIIIFFPLLFLLRFSNNMKTAIHANDQEAMNEAFLNMKRYFRFLGILFIIGLAFYALVFVVAIFSSAMN
jgi:hypothetical protein